MMYDKHYMNALLNEFARRTNITLLSCCELIFSQPISERIAINPGFFFTSSVYTNTDSLCRVLGYSNGVFSKHALDYVKVRIRYGYAKIDLTDLMLDTDSMEKLKAHYMVNKESFFELMCAKLLEQDTNRIISKDIMDILTRCELQHRKENRQFLCVSTIKKLSETIAMLNEKPCMKSNPTSDLIRECVGLINSKLKENKSNPEELNRYIE